MACQWDAVAAACSAVATVKGYSFTSNRQRRKMKARNARRGRVRTQDLWVASQERFDQCSCNSRGGRTHPNLFSAHAMWPSNLSGRRLIASSNPTPAAVPSRCDLGCVLRVCVCYNAPTVGVGEGSDGAEAAGGSCWVRARVLRTSYRALLHVTVSESVGGRWRGACAWCAVCCMPRAVCFLGMGGGSTHTCGACGRSSPTG